ncbi:MAG: ligase-associated DNA damage response exonuclease [Rhizobiales bacterium]|nr:ligase-associated DNA damage response exonuclease [Hyphomicrobiales bacterium]
MRGPSGIEDWLRLSEAGLYCAPGDFHVDPHRAVQKAVVTHGHADHARPGHRNVLATPETLAVMRQRYGAKAGCHHQPLQLGEVIDVNGVRMWLAPAGHVLGSAQVVLEWRGQRAVISGDYKRAADPTCAPFETVHCDLLVTEATFALPVFRHEPAELEIAKLLRSLAAFPERTHLIGAYGLGKSQRLIRCLRDAGFDQTIWLHGALTGLCSLYQQLGIELGRLEPATGAPREVLKGAIVLAPPSAGKDRWARRLTDPVVAFASGWMRVRGRARQSGVELPLVISDHADWDGLTDTITETGAGEVWVTHGREDALVHWCQSKGIAARALSMVGREDEDA